VKIFLKKNSKRLFHLYSLSYQVLVFTIFLFRNFPDFSQLPLLIPKIFPFDEFFPCKSKEFIPVGQLALSFLKNLK